MGVASGSKEALEADEATLNAISGFHLGRLLALVSHGVLVPIALCRVVMLDRLGWPRAGRCRRLGVTFFAPEESYRRVVPPGAPRLV